MTIFFFLCCYCCCFFLFAAMHDTSYNGQWLRTIYVQTHLNLFDLLNRPIIVHTSSGKPVLQRCLFMIWLQHGLTSINIFIYIPMTLRIITWFSFILSPLAIISTVVVHELMRMFVYFMYCVRFFLLFLTFSINSNNTISYVLTNNLEVFKRRFLLLPHFVANTDEAYHKWAIGQVYKRGWNAF